MQNGPQRNDHETPILLNREPILVYFQQRSVARDGNRRIERDNDFFLRPLSEGLHGALGKGEVAGCSLLPV